MFLAAALGSVAASVVALSHGLVHSHAVAADESVDDFVGSRPEIVQSGAASCPGGWMRLLYRGREDIEVTLGHG